MNKLILILILVLAPVVSYGADVIEVQFVSAGFNDAGHKIRGDTIQPPGQFVIRGTQTPVRFVNVVPVRQVFIVNQPIPVFFHNSQFVITQVAVTSSATFITNEWRY